MKRNCLARVLGTLVILVLLFASSYRTVPAIADENSPAGVTKVSSSLSLHIKLKSQNSGNQAHSFGLAPETGSPALMKFEKVFLYFHQPPTASQLEDLASQGVKPYPDSWIPPVGNHPSGFILADMPVNELDALSAKDYIVQMDSAEQEAQPQNDLARTAMGVDSVWSGGYTGAGVKVAVLDSGIDTSNPDFPPLDATNSRDYSDYPTLDDTIINTVTGHGTHVTGSLLGRGVNSPGYKGVAPDASLVFLKIGNDTNGFASSAAVTYAIRDAVDVYQADIISLSYGGWDEYHDGSSQDCQAVDYAVSKGAAVFVSSGNTGHRNWHYSATAGPNSVTGDIPIVVASGNNKLPLNLVWFDGQGIHNDLKLQYYHSTHNQLPSTNGNQSESPRGTESRQSQLTSAGSSGTYYLRVTNNSASSQLFHIYSEEGDTAVSFSSPDSNYTITSPAEADSAIAVGAYVTRTSWTDYPGSLQNSSTGTTGSIAAFSSRGPRVDVPGWGKPDIVAPGQEIISVRDNSVYPWPAYNTGADIFPYAGFIIDNDGQNQDGSGPADYFVMKGTSMSCPLAAGVGALILSRNPALTPAQIRHALESTATDKGDSGRDNAAGWGLVNAGAAINAGATLIPYSDAAHTTTCNTFSSPSTQNTAYLSGSGYLINHGYQLVYYAGSKHKVATDYVTSDSTGVLSSMHHFLLGPDKPGAWQAIVCEPEFNLPNLLDIASPYTIAACTFTVQTAAIVTPGPAVISTITLGDSGYTPTGLEVNAATNRVYVAGIHNNNVSVIDGSNDTIIATINVGFWPEGVAINPDTNRIYVSNALSSTVSVIDGDSNSEVAVIDVGFIPFRLGVNVITNRIYVANSFSDDVSVIDGATNTVMATIPVGSGPAGIGVNPATNRIYVSNDGDNNVSVIDGANNNVVAMINVGSGPGGIGVNPETGRIYVSNYWDDSVSVIDGADNSVVATPKVGIAPRGVAVNTVTNRIFVANDGGNSISIIDGATSNVGASSLGTVYVDDNPFGLGVNAATNRIYVTNSGSDTVSVIQDIATLSSLTRITSSSNPSAINRPVTFTALVSSESPVPNQPAGLVTFKDGDKVLGTGPVNGSGQARFTTSALGAGQHSIVAVYSGDFTFMTSTGTLTQTVMANVPTSSNLSLGIMIAGFAVLITIFVLRARRSP